jgi:hypothetical protein
MWDRSCEVAPNMQPHSLNKRLICLERRHIARKVWRKLLQEFIKPRCQKHHHPLLYGYDQFTRGRQCAFHWIDRTEHPANSGICYGRL